MSCGVGHRHSSDPMLLWLWLWLWPAAVVLIGPLAWELTYDTGAALKKTAKKKKAILSRVPSVFSLVLLTSSFFDVRPVVILSRFAP